MSDDSIVERSGCSEGPPIVNGEVQFGADVLKVTRNRYGVVLRKWQKEQKRTAKYRKCRDVSVLKVLSVDDALDELGGIG